MSQDGGCPLVSKHGGCPQKVLLLERVVVLRVVAYYESGLGGVVKAMLGQEKGRDGSLGGTGQPGQERILVACDRLTDGWALPAASTPTNIFTWKLQKYLHSFHVPYP